MVDEVVIPARFNGPPDSGHGGYSSGLAASLVEGDAEVSLRAPPPLDTPLRVKRAADGEVALLNGDTLIAEARPAEIDFDPPAAITLEQAEEAISRSPFSEDTHPFPTCFGCGPLREAGDGLRLFPGPVGGRGVTGVPWTPAEEVDEVMLWAALDCPSGSPATNPDNHPPIVLANLAAKQIAPVRVGDEHVIVAELVETDGRKKHTHVALYSASGELRAIARALWISLRTDAA